MLSQAVRASYAFIKQREQKYSVRRMTAAFEDALKTTDNPLFCEETTMPDMNIACHCGQVKIKLTGEPVADLYCHCHDCQRIAGGGYVPYSIYPHAAVEVTEGKTFKWALKNNQRTRCATCGTYLFGDPAGMGIHGISAYLLPVGVFEPKLHIMCKDALLPVKDDLPHFVGFPASLGGSDDEVDWSVF